MSLLALTEPEANLESIMKETLKNQFDTTTYTFAKNWATGMTQAKANEFASSALPNCSPC